MLSLELNNILDIYYHSSSSFNNVVAMNNELIKIFKKKSLKKFLQKDIELYLRQLRANNNSSSTINSKLVHLNKCLKYYGTKLIIPYQKVKNKEKEIISQTQYEYLKEEFKANNDVYKFIVLAYHTGMRANEILNIRIQHFKYDSGVYFLNLYNTKNHKDNYIPLSKEVNHIVENFEEFNINYKQLYYELKKYSITPHQFRHSFITRAYEKGLDSFTIMKLTNQTSLSVHQRYNHISNSRLRDIVQVL